MIAPPNISSIEAPCSLRQPRKRGASLRLLEIKAYKEFYKKITLAISPGPATCAGAATGLASQKNSISSPRFDLCGIARKANASLDPSASRSRSSRPEELTSMRMKSASAFGSALLFAAAVFG
jgi:hypothetical protein